MDFYQAEPTAFSSWRMAILMGANSRTYKFALGHALLTLAAQGRDSATLAEIALPYSLAMAEHAQEYPQAPKAGNLGEEDYLQVLATEAAATLASGVPTERLVDATTKSMPGMVMTKFHNLRGMDGVPHRFYDMPERGASGLVRFTTYLTEVGTSVHMSVLGEELGTRWSLVESAFDAEIGAALVREGVLVDAAGVMLLDPVRRAPVARARQALIGFQHGRCFYCHTRIDDVNVDAHVDHVYPYSLMKTGVWAGPNLNGVWNLVVACAPCNLSKSNRPPSGGEIQRLVERNQAILTSPYPLKRAVQLLLTQRGNTPASFYEWVASEARLEPRWL